MVVRAGPTPKISEAICVSSGWFHCWNLIEFMAGVSGEIEQPWLSSFGHR